MIKLNTNQIHNIYGVNYVCNMMVNRIAKGKSVWVLGLSQLYYILIVGSSCSLVDLTDYDKSYYLKNILVQAY